MLQYFDISPANKNLKLEKFLSKTEKDLAKFFGIKIDKPKIFFVNSRKDMDKIWSEKTEDWFSGWAVNSNIFILHPEKFNKESSHKKIDFWKTLKHEYVHLYFTKLTGCRYPKWLNEGLACYLADQVKVKIGVDKSVRVFSYFKKYDSMIYFTGYFWVKLLIKNFGHKKLLKLLKQLKPDLTEKKFANIFYKVYKIKFTKKDLSNLL